MKRGEGCHEAGGCGDRRSLKNAVECSGAAPDGAAESNGSGWLHTDGVAASVDTDLSGLMGGLRNPMRVPRMRPCLLARGRRSLAHPDVSITVCFASRTEPLCAPPAPGPPGCTNQCMPTERGFLWRARGAVPLPSGCRMMVQGAGNRSKIVARASDAAEV
jgi:hypothetical protein